MEEQELPLGLGMALAQHPGALQRFAALSEAERQSVVESAHAVRSKAEMQTLVDYLTADM